MLIFALDDEPLILQDFEAAIREAAPNADVMTFSRGAAALETIQKQNVYPDIVFSDIEMPGISGLNFAVRLKTLSPQTRIVFVTSYAQYALDAFAVRAQGYVIKPLTADQVREELAQLSASPPPPKPAENKLRVQCFGHFEIYWNNKPVVFSRKQSKELFAFLIDREGAACTSEQIASALWENVWDPKVYNHRIRNLVRDLKNSLRAIGMEQVLIREKRQLAVCRDLVDCDYYRMLEGDMTAINAYRGEYMVDYSWAESTNARLYFQNGNESDGPV